MAPLDLSVPLIARGASTEWGTAHCVANRPCAYWVSAELPTECPLDAPTVSPIARNTRLPACCPLSNRCLPAYCPLNCPQPSDLAPGEGAKRKGKWDGGRDGQYIYKQQ